jgi:hypothetical protein
MSNASVAPAGRKRFLFLARRAASFFRKERIFFSEEKKQKTFMH